MLRCVIALLLTLALAGCTTTPDGDRPPGRQSCESFFIYVLCVADLDFNGSVDYMYFDDTREIFMYHKPMQAELNGVLPYHACAIPMSDSTRDYASQLLYGNDLGISQRLGIKGRLITQYRASQPAVDACSSDGGPDVVYDPEEDPFLADEDWDDEGL